jgi:methyltransferase (TIGR00027 family)
MIIRFSMKSGQLSRTAEHMAFFRALESVRPPKQRLFADPLASQFLNPPLRLMADLARFQPFRSLLYRYVDRRCPGARTSGIARTRLIDDLLTAGLQDGLSQVVILGAGFDARAYRLNCGKRVSFFEVDHPDTLTFKRTRLSAISAVWTPNIRYVEIDFNSQNLSTALTQAGFNPAQRTFFIWEGVTNYLSPDAVAATLQFIGSVAHRSRLIFTYVHSDFFRAPHLYPGVVRLKRDLERFEEPWTFGLDPAEIPLLLRRHGLCLLKDLGSIEYRMHYLGQSPRTLYGYEFYRAALAEVIPIRNTQSQPSEQREATSNA